MKGGFRTLLRKGRAEWESVQSQAEAVRTEQQVACAAVYLTPTIFFSHPEPASRANVPLALLSQPCGVVGFKRGQIPGRASLRLPPPCWLEAPMSPWLLCTQLQPGLCTPSAPQRAP